MINAQIGNIMICVTFGENMKINMLLKRERGKETMLASLSLQVYTHGQILSGFIGKWQQNKLLQVLNMLRCSSPGV